MPDIIMSRDDVIAMPDSQDHKQILLDNMRINGWDCVIRLENGMFQPPFPSLMEKHRRGIPIVVDNMFPDSGDGPLVPGTAFSAHKLQLMARRVASAAVEYCKDL
jgi:hypothetical protein